MSINKTKFIEDLGAKSKLTRSEAERILDDVIHLIYYHLQRGETVNLSGFGKFDVRTRKGSMGVNPRDLTGPWLMRPDTTSVHFTAGEGAKNAIR